MGHFHLITSNSSMEDTVYSTRGYTKVGELDNWAERRLHDVRKWIQHNCVGEVIAKKDTGQFYFENEEDAGMFCNGFQPLTSHEPPHQRVAACDRLVLSYVRRPFKRRLLGFIEDTAEYSTDLRNL